MTINCELIFDYNNQEVVFKDLEGASHDSSDMTLGILRVSSNGVVIYENKGWDTGSFLSPDTFKDNWEVKILDLDGEEIMKMMEDGKFTIEYKLTNNGTGITVTESSETILVSHNNPTPEISISTNYSTGKIIVEDITDYGKNTAELSSNRLLSLVYPEDNGLNTVYTNEAVLEGLLLNAYGLVTSNLESYPVYVFKGTGVSVRLETAISGTATYYTVDNPLIINPFNCLSKLAVMYERALYSKDTSALVAEETLKELTAYTMMYSYTVENNLDYTFFLNKISEITSECECSLVGYNGNGDNDPAVDLNVYEYLSIQLKEFYEQRNTNNIVADQRLSVINMIITWYVIYSIASEEDKAIPLQKLNYYTQGYEAKNTEAVEDLNDYSVCISHYVDCVNKQAKHYESNKLENTTLVFDSSRRLLDMVNFFQLFLLGVGSSMDKTYTCGIMRGLMFACGCGDGSGDGGGGETPPSEENPFVLWGNVPSKDAVTIEDVEALGDMEQRSDRFGVISELDGGGNYPCVVVPTSFLSPGIFRYNNYTYEFFKLNTLSYTDENENTYDVDVFVWRTQNYGVWNQVIPL